MELKRKFEKSYRIEEAAELFIICGQRLGVAFSRLLFEQFASSDPSDKMGPLDFATLVAAARLSAAAIKLFRQEPFDSVQAISVTCCFPAGGMRGSWEFATGETNGVVVTLRIEADAEKKTGELGDDVAAVFECSVILSGEEAPLLALAERCPGEWK